VLGGIVVAAGSASVGDGPDAGGLGPTEVVTLFAGPIGALLSAAYLFWRLRAIRGAREPWTAP
jgi:hypothetical protein